MAVVDPNCIMELEAENIEACVNEEIPKGLSEVGLYYIPVAHLKALEIPLQTGDLESIVQITKAIEAHEGKKFGRIMALVDENELNSTIAGNKGAKGDQTSLTFFLLGLKDKNKGFVKRNKNIPHVYIAKDRAGNKHLIGNLDNPAYMDTAEGTSGRTGEDNPGYAITVNSPSFCYTLKAAFPGETPLPIPTAEGGD
ncbi:hypothetical protein [Empedobacter tilapiae]